MEIKKVIIPMAGLGTRFLPLSKVVPKEFWPLADGEPVIQSIINEAVDSEIKEIIFVLSPGNKKILEYLKPSSKIEKILKERKKQDLLERYKIFEKSVKEISYSYVYQKNPLGDGHAVLQAFKLLNKNEPVAVLFADDLVIGGTKPCLSQLITIFKSCEKPVLALSQVDKEKIHSYGVVQVEKIAHRFFKIKTIVEKPKFGEEPSDLAICGKYILTPDIFEFLEKAKPNDKKEIILAEVFREMLNQGKTIYGYQFEGKWLECGTKDLWLKSLVYLALKNYEKRAELIKFLKKNKLI